MRLCSISLSARTTIFLVSCLFLYLIEDVSARMFHNQFALYIPKGEAAADALASKHGFVNLGVIGSLEDYYLFEHHGIQKRSTEASLDHTAMLLAEADVKWAEQMVEKRRSVKDNKTLHNGDFQIVRRQEYALP